jgi:hypothetical protein
MCSGLPDYHHLASLSWQHILNRTCFQKKSKRIYWSLLIHFSKKNALQDFLTAAHFYKERIRR